MSLYPDPVQHRATVIVETMSRNGLKLATAESCTGGLIAGAITQVAGSSAVLERGFVTYSNEAKTAMLGVDAALIIDQGAVAEDVARAMAEGALAQSLADVAVSCTGIAGPGGGSAEKPVGLVHMACASKTGTTVHRECRFGDTGREQVRLMTVEAALDMVLDMIGAGS